MAKSSSHTSGGSALTRFIGDLPRREAHRKTSETATQAQATENVPAAVSPPPEPWQENFAQELLSRILGDAGPDQTKRRAEPRNTSLGTPCARSWDDAWVAKVEATEQRLQHRICGARTMAGNPCELASNHDNGRCRFHGGFPLTGAAPGNRNAVIHALYSRRLRTCDTRCPQWSQCPCAGPDVQAMPPMDRPTCPYEQVEYNTALTDALGRAATCPEGDPFLLHIAHNTALLQVMMTRASLALRNEPLIDTVIATRDASDHAGAYQMQSTKPSAHLQAFMRIAAEYRQFAAMLKSRERHKASVAEHLNRTSRAMADTDLDPDRQDLLHPNAATALNQTQRHISDAIEQAFAGDNVRARQSFQSARAMSTSCTPPYESPVNGATYPEFPRLSDWTVKTLVDHMNKTHPSQ